MTFDPVHDLQTAFRTLLEAFSFPGRAVDLSVPAHRLGPWIPDPEANLALALGAAVLVDQEVPYSIVGAGALTRFLADWTASRPTVPREAAFLVLPEFDDARFADLLAQVPEGTLGDPHRGATVLVGTDDLDQGDRCELSGPGIPAPVVRNLPPGDRWKTMRNRRTAEYPLGIDLVFFDRRGQAVALPRTTRLSSPGEV